MNNTVVTQLILQSTPFCNLRCTYCYLPERSESSKFSHSQLRRLLEYLVSEQLIGSYFSVLWHLGEPLAAGIKWTEECVYIVREVLGDSVQIQFSLQTNGTLITDNWCRFLSGNDVSVGVSLDGPMPANDIARVNRLGVGTYSAVIKGIDLLRKHFIDFHVISVLTPAVVDDPESYLAFLEEIGITKVAFNVPSIKGICKDPMPMTSTKQYEEKLRKFLSFLISHTIHNPGRLRIREFELLGGAIQEFGNLQDAAQIPLRLLSVDHRGDIFTFSPELASLPDDIKSRYIIGHVSEDFCTIDFNAIDKISSEVNSGINRCRSKCTYFKVCGGGAVSSKVAENGTADSLETLFCRIGVQLFSDELIKSLLNAPSDNTTSSYSKMSLGHN